MINAFLVFNGQGQPRLTKFYTQLVGPPCLPWFGFAHTLLVILTASRQDTGIQQRLISEIFTLVSNRPSGSCNFLPLPPLLAASGTSNSSSEPHNDVPSLVTYRNYATLYFIIISTSTESPLALIDLIQVYVEALDKLFENVCELDLIFNFETLHATLGEMIVGGVVIETNLDRIVAGVKAQGTVAKRPVNESRGSGLGAGLGMWHGR
jgi:AP-3 complex subunit sigma